MLVTGKDVKLLSLSFYVLGTEEYLLVHQILIIQCTSVHG